MALDLQQLGPYQLVEPLGRGGMATVYRGYHRALERYVAVKVLPLHLAAEPGFRERFHREAVAIARLRHPNILTVFDHGQEGEHAYIVTELFTGGSLADQLGQPLPTSEVTRLLAPIADALDHAHRQGVIHRDVKPSNILLTGEGTPVLADFGLARTLSDGGTRLTLADSVLGTPEYMSPEQCQGVPLTPASDQYSLGLVAYEMLAGSVPFHAETPAGLLVAQIMQAPPSLRSRNPQLPNQIDEALSRSLAKGPGDRFPTCSSLVAALAPGPVDSPLPAPTLPIAPSAPRPVKRSHPARWTAAALLVMLLVASGLWLGINRLHLPPTRASTSAPTPAPSGTPAPTPSAAGLGPARGALVYEAKLHGSTEDLRKVSPSDTSDVKLGEDLELSVQSGGTTAVQLNMPSVQDYIGEIEVAAVPPANLDFNWVLRQEGSRAVLLSLAASGDTMALERINSDGTTDTLVADVPVTGAHEGRQAMLAAMVQRNVYRIYVDGKQMAEVSDNSDSPISGGIVPWISVDQGEGTVRILAARFYDLP